MERINAEEHLGLVHLCARRFRERGIEYDELYSAGCMGLVKAARAFDGSRGVKFSTYAVPVILGEIKRLFRDGGTVKVSRSTKELSLKIVRTREELTAELGREPTLDELSEKLGESREDVILAIGSSSPPLSLTGGYEDEEEGQIDVPVESPEEGITDKLALREALGRLSGEDRRLIYLRYAENKTQVMTAKELGMTQVQVSRREKKILERMRAEIRG